MTGWTKRINRHDRDRFRRRTKPFMLWLKRYEWSFTFDGMLALYYQGEIRKALRRLSKVQSFWRRVTS